MSAPAAATQGPPPGLDRASPYAHYLWHLHDAGVLRLAHEAGPVPRYRVEGAVWDDLYREGVAPSLVAVIDNGCSTTHPHLPPGEALIEAPCFASHDFGAIHGVAPGAEDDPALPAAGREGARNHFAAAAEREPRFWRRVEALASNGERHAPMDRLRGVIADLRETPGVVREVASYAEDFPVHGTLTAGLIAARPPAGRGEALPYFGVDPRARVLALNTALRPDFRGLIHALLFAAGMGADVLCVPRAIWRPDPHEEEPDPHRPDDPRASRLDTDHRLQVDAALFEVALHVLAERVPVFLAAGNNGFARTQVYPALLAREGNGLISVGALSGRGDVAGYSNTGGVTVFAPSDDAEAWDRAQRRLDPHGRASREHALPAAAEPGQRVAEASGWGVLSTDIPGAFGDASGGMEPHARGEPDTQRSLFAPFGGTSAACAIAAGVASLLQAKRRARGEAPLTGPEMKRHLRAHCPRVSDLPTGEPVLRIDAAACLAAL